MPNLSGIAHRVEYIATESDIREPLLLRKRDRSSSMQSYASTTITTTSALTNLHHAQTFHHSGQSHHLADYSPSSKSSPARRERSLSRSPEGSTKTWRREGTTRVPRLVSNESIEHERSSSEEFEEFERAEPELRDEAVFELSAESSSSPTRFMRRTREIWDETSNMHFAKPQPPYQMATINVNVPTALASKIHKFLYRQLSRVRYRSGGKSSVGGGGGKSPPVGVALGAAAVQSSTANAAYVSKSGNSQSHGYSGHLSSTRVTRSKSQQGSNLEEQRVSGQRRQFTSRSRTSMSSSESIIGNTITKAKRWCHSIAESVRDLDANLHLPFLIIFLFLLMLALPMLNGFGSNLRSYFNHYRDVFSVDSPAHFASNSPSTQSEDASRQQDLFSRIQILESELYKLKQSGKTITGQDKENPRALEGQSESLRQELLDTQSQIAKFAKSLKSLEVLHASLNLSDAKLQNSFAKLTLELSGNIENSRLKFEEIENNMKVLATASGSQVGREAIHQIGASIAELKQHVKESQEKSKSEFEEAVRGSSLRLEDKIRTLETRIESLEASNLGFKKCCLLAEELHANMSADTIKLNSFQDQIRDLEAVIAEMSTQINENKATAEFLKGEVLLNREQTRPNMEWEGEKREFVRQNDFELAMDRHEKKIALKIQELIALKLNSSCKSSSGQLQPPFVQDTLLSFFQSSSEKQSSSISDSADANFSILSQYLNSYFYNITTTTNQLRTLVREEVHRALIEDGTGVPDYALESVGGSVVTTRCTETYTQYASVVSIMGIPLWYQTPSPRTVIQPDMHPGNCWPFTGSNGQIVIRLARRLKVQSVSYQHIPQSISPTGTTSSAPKNISIYGLNSENEDPGSFLGNFEYTLSTTGQTLQTFKLDALEANQESLTFRFVSIVVHSNHGNDAYTCLYRFRVHGQVKTN
ncbi:klaroid protein-like isoform X2 [Symsagittifera roscoffensis]